MSGEDSRNARSSSGTNEYIAEPTKPTARRPTSPRWTRRAWRAASSTASRISRARTQEHGPGRGQLDLALVAQQQRRADLLLELADLLAQRRLGHVQALRGTAEVQLLGDGDEVAQVAELHDDRHDGGHRRVPRTRGDHPARPAAQGGGSRRQRRRGEGGARRRRRDRQRRGGDPARTPARARRRDHRRRRVGAGSRDARRVRGRLRAGDRQVGGRARRPAAARPPGRAARRLPARGRRPRARPAARPAAPERRGLRPLRGVVRRRLRRRARRRGARARGDRRALPRAGRAVRRRAVRRHGLRRRRARPASWRSTRASRSTSGCRRCAWSAATTARRTRSATRSRSR